MDWEAKAKHFLEHETQFHLGMLPTEQSHPRTRGLAETLQRDAAAGIAMLQAVDQEVATAADRVLAGAEFAQLVETLSATLRSGGRVCFSGCGATGRLSILVEACWRHFWRDVAAKQPALGPLCGEMANRVCSIMTGGDYALIRSVENFEDHVSFGRQQVKEAGLGPGDVLAAVSEGGETSSVIGTIWEAHERGARTFFLFNNPADILARHIERSRAVIEHPAVTILDLSSGPMAVAGSTRMQATTSELLVAGAALELALGEACRDAGIEGLPGDMTTPQEYVRRFHMLLSELTDAASVQAMADWVRFEQELYEQKGLVTYFADGCLLDIFTDTTERAPTFMLPPFRKNDDSLSLRSWAFVKDPLRSTPEAWHEMLQREPRGLDWGPEVYEQLSAPAELKANPPRLDNAEIYKFQIGNEPGASRIDAPDSALVVIEVGGQTGDFASSALKRFGAGYKRTAAMTIGPAFKHKTDNVFEFPCDLPSSSLRLWDHLAVKLILNTISTATMVRMDRVIGNAMVWLSPSNKKLIDRGSRLISQQTGCTYEQACIELHMAIEQVQSRQEQGEEAPSPVALAIERIRAKHDKA